MDLDALREDIDQFLRTEILTGQTSLTVGSVLLFVLTLVVFFIVSIQARRWTARWLANRSQMDPGLRYTLARAIQYAVFAVGAVVALDLIGIDFTRLGLVLGFLSVGIGFGLQNITSNFVAGLILLIERPVSVGDRVTVGETEGDITAINMRSTVVRSLQNVSIIVPNQELVTSNVVNWTHHDPRIRMSVYVGVSYGSNVDTVIEALYEVAREHPRVLAEPPPHVRLNDFGDSAWNMELLVWLHEAKEYRDVRSELNIAMVHKFRERGVEIPFPQRDLHMRSAAPIPIEDPRASE